MKRMISLVLLCLLAMLPAMASCEELAIINQDSITVTGTAVVVLEPDYVDLYLGTDTYNTNLADVIREYKEKTDAIQAALAEFGIQEEDIFNIYPYKVNIIYSTSTETTYSAPRVRGYRLTDSIFYRIKNIENIGAIIDKAIQSGADTCDKIVFGSTVADTIYDEAMNMAIEDAYRKATSMAGSRQAKVGKVMNMIENEGSYQGIRLMRGAGENQEYKQIEVICNDMEFKASVTITFELE